VTILLSSLAEAEIRSICKEKLESLEHWLRRLVDDTLQPIYGDYFSHVDSHGNRLISTALSLQVENRRRQEPNRYPRKIDAVLLDDAIAIICKPDLYKSYFGAALRQAFPEGREEARTFLQRILAPRNNLAHSNAISARTAEQIVCYSNDIIDSLKSHYRKIGMQQEYDAPLILKVTDSFGQVFTRSQCSVGHDAALRLDFTGKSTLCLRPKDVVTIELEVDPAYEPESYDLTWSSTKGLPPSISGRKAVIEIENRYVGQSFDIQCRLKAKREWHRMSTGVDDLLVILYKVLPPLS